jgi:hypothetical protein
MRGGQEKVNLFIPKYKNSEYSQGKINLNIARINHTCSYDCFVFNVKPTHSAYGKNRIDQLASPAVKAGLRGLHYKNKCQAVFRRGSSKKT